MLSTEQTSQLWQTMIEPTRFGIPRWKSAFDPSPTDPRSNPINFMLMCESFDLPSCHELDISHLKKITDGEYRSETAENTGILGLLRTIPLMNAVTIERPKNVLLVGSMNHSGVTGLCLWLEANGWIDTHITVVDKELISLHTVEQLIQIGLINWKGGIDLIKSDIRNFSPQNKFDLVVGDILNPYIDSYIGYPRLEEASPYRHYEEYLRQAKSLTNHWFFSRCFVVPERREHFGHNSSQSNLPSEERLEQVWENLGTMTAKLDKQETLATEDVFAGYSPTSYCGLWLHFANYRAKNILSGKKAERVYNRLYQRHFPNSHRSITIRDSQSRTFINFACNLGESG